MLIIYLEFVIFEFLQLLISLYCFLKVTVSAILSSISIDISLRKIIDYEEIQ